MSARDQIRMTDEERASFLDDHVKLQVATLSRDGSPHVTTLFYGFLDEHVTFWTYGTSQKAVNLRRDPRIAGLVEDGENYDELRGVSITGRADLVEDRDGVLDLGLRLAGRNRDALNEDAREVIERQVSKRIGVIIRPEAIMSWDHTKL